MLLAPPPNISFVEAAATGYADPLPKMSFMPPPIILSGYYIGVDYGAAPPPNMSPIPPNRSLLPPIGYGLAKLFVDGASNKPIKSF